MLKRATCFNILASGQNYINDFDKFEKGKTVKRALLFKHSPIVKTTKKKRDQRGVPNNFVTLIIGETVEDTNVV